MTSARVLQIDAGNSRAKWRVMTAGQPAARGSSDLADAEALDRLAREVEAVDEVWLASVLGPEEEKVLLAALRASPAPPVVRAESQAFCAGVRNSYAEPGRMGVDRWLALLAARARHPAHLCVVDAGTALTIDWLAADGQHEGGHIIPGPALMESALFAGTGRVRASDAAQWKLEPGADTASAVGSGINLALVGALREALLRHGDSSAPNDAPGVVVTGGYGRELIDLLDLTAEYVADLVFDGLEIAVREGQAKT